MEEERKNLINEDRNIFYEYFSKLEKAEIDYEVPKFEEIENAYNNVRKEYESLMALKENELNIILQSCKSQRLIFNKTLGLLLKKIPTDSFNPFIQASTEYFKISVAFFRQYKYNKNDIFDKILSKIEELSFFSALLLSLYCAKNLFNIVEHFHTIIICIFKKDICKYYDKGYKILGITKAEIIFKIILKILSSFCLNKYMNCKKLSITLSLFWAFISNKLCLKEGTPNDNKGKFKEYFCFADEAYNYKSKKGETESSCGIYNIPLKKCSNFESLVHFPSFVFDFNNEVSGLGWCWEEQIIIGFSGTQNAIMVLVDISQIAGLSPAYVFAVGFVGCLKEKYPNNSFILCGHSLGGGLSQFAAAPYKSNVEAYCFNSAGLFCCSYNKIKKFKDFNNIFHYRLEWDPVSCFGKLIGEVYTQRSKCSIYNHCCKAIKKSLDL